MNALVNLSREFNLSNSHQISLWYAFDIVGFNLQKETITPYGCTLNMWEHCESVSHKKAA